MKAQTLTFFIVSLLVLLSSSLVFINTKLRDYGIEAKTRTSEIGNSHGVHVHYQYSQEAFFPHNRLVLGSQAWIKNISTTLPLVEEFLSKYPREVITNNLSDIFLLATVEFNGKSFGGTYSGSAIYISTGAFFKYSDLALLGLMHAEFSSILFHKYKFPIEEWERVNKPAWRYLGSGVDMLGRTEVYHQTAALLQDGFLEGYSQASIEEDFNKFAEYIFTRPDRLRKLASEYERIRTKSQLVIKFYKSIDPQIDIPGIIFNRDRGENISSYSFHFNAETIPHRGI